MADYEYEYSLVHSYDFLETLGTFGGFISILHWFLDKFGSYFFRQSYHFKMFRQLYYTSETLTPKDKRNYRRSFTNINTSLD